MKRFRMTLWPSDGLPHPTTWNRIEYRLLDDLPVLIPVHRDDVWSPVECETDEIYLELCAVDLDDPDAILAFVNRWGVMGLRGNDWSLLVNDYARSLELHVPGLAKSLAAVSGEIAAARAVPKSVVSKLAFVETLDEFRYGAMLVRDMANAYELLTAADVSGVKFEPDGWTHGRAPDSQSAAMFLSRQMDPALRSFHPTVQPEFFEAVNPLPAPAQNLYATCCLEIFNHIASGESYRHCANEPCGRRFMRQRGRSEVGQKRASGVLYCSKSCAQAQASRQNRRRNRAKREARAAADS